MDQGAGPAARVLPALRATRPTADGAKVLNLAILFLVLALGRPHATLYGGLALFGALYLVGHLGAARAGASLRVAAEAPARVFAGEEFPLRVAVRNGGRAAVHGVIAVPAAGGAAEGPAVGSIPPGGTATLEVPARVRRRGNHALPAPTVEVTWPFGLARWRPAPGEDLRVLAYPRRVPVRSPPDPAAPIPEASSRVEALASPRGGEAVRGLRPWAPGDPARAIAWRATVRHGRLLSREFERLDAGRVIVALDADPRTLPGHERPVAFERALSTASSTLLRLRAEGRRAAFAAWTPEATWIPEATSPAGLVAALERLALHRSVRPGDPHRDPLALVPRGALRRARALVIRPPGARAGGAA